MDLFQIDTVGEHSLLNEDRNKNVKRNYFESESSTKNAVYRDHSSTDNNDVEDSENEYDYYGE